MTSLPPRVRVVVLFGGRSAEHDVSRLSAANILAALDPERYEVVPIGIDRQGGWHATPALATGGAGDLGGLPVTGDPTDPLPALRSAATSPPAAPASAATEIPLVVLPVLHGPNGEDGTVQGLLELAGVAYVGSGVLGSALAMDKAMAKTVLQAAGLPQARYRVVREWELTPEVADDVVADLGLPLFVKPANMGSSVGVSRVTDRSDLDAAFAAAFAHDELVVIEEGITGRELEIGVLGNEAPRTSVPGEIIPAADFYDFDDKYRDGAAKTIVPADLTEAESAEMSRLALAAVAALRIEGLARVDMFYDAAGRGFVINEINTFPGFTPISMFPMMWAASGLGYSELLDEMIRLALERHQRRSR